MATETTNGIQVLTCCLDNAEIANALVGQRDQLATAVAYAEDSKDLAAAEKTLGLLADLWFAVGYGYKVREFRLKIKTRAELLYRSNLDLLAALRKNDRIRGGVESDNVRLKGLAGIE